MIIMSKSHKDKMGKNLEDRFLVVIKLCIKVFFITLLFIALTNTVYALGERPILIAHRGFSLGVYENTIPSIIEARSHLFDGVEIDVIETKDGILVLSHSDKIEIYKPNGEETVFHIMKENYSDINQHVLQESSEYGDIRFSRLDDALKMLALLDMDVVLHCKIHTLEFFQKVARTVAQSSMKGKCILTLPNRKK